MQTSGISVFGNGSRKFASMRVATRGHLLRAPTW
jgi:hypothetical protein